MIPHPHHSPLCWLSLEEEVAIAEAPLAGAWPLTRQLIPPWAALRDPSLPGSDCHLPVTFRPPRGQYASPLLCALPRPLQAVRSRAPSLCPWVAWHTRHCSLQANPLAGSHPRRLLPISLAAAGILAALSLLVVILLSAETLTSFGYVLRLSRVPTSCWHGSPGCQSEPVLGQAAPAAAGSQGLSSALPFPRPFLPLSTG